MRQVGNTLFSIIASLGALLPTLVYAEDSRGVITLPHESELEDIVVTSTPLQSSLNDSVQPVTVLNTGDLEKNTNQSLGEVLSSQPGVSSTGFGPGASRPVIRGLGSDRVRILENGTGTQDVSNVSPDHGVSLDPLLAEKIEVVRGPASLMYGTSAVGGVVNVITGRIQEDLPEADTSGRVEARTGSVNDERAGAAVLNAKLSDQIVFHLDTSKRVTNDIKIPGFARTQNQRTAGPELEYPEPKGRLPYSATDTDSIGTGISYISDTGFVGLSVDSYGSVYGVPNGEKDVSIDMERTRYELRGRYDAETSLIKNISYRASYADYKHTEFHLHEHAEDEHAEDEHEHEDEDVSHEVISQKEAGTRFNNKGFEGRFDIRHQPYGALNGVFGAQIQHGDFSALGEEAFQPPTETLIVSPYVFEDYKLTEALSLQAGVRLDLQQLDTQALAERGFRVDSRNDTTVSASSGLLYQPTKDFSYGVSFGHTERAPSGQELFANGPHVATGAFEIGDRELAQERSYGLDLTAKKLTGDLTGSAGVFYNRFDNYIGLTSTGAMQDNLSVYRFTPQQADFYGFEGQAKYAAFSNDVHTISFDLQPDYVRAKDRETDRAVARIPPFRLKAGINYAYKALLDARIEAQHVFAQNKIADLETTTAGYTMLNATLSHEHLIGRYLAEFFVQGNNLLNEEARNHVSFIKDIAPMAGRGVIGGVRFHF